MTPISPAAHAVIFERQRQIEQEGWTPEHDDQHGSGELAEAAACYAEASADPEGSDVPLDSLCGHWPWSVKWWKPSKDRRRNLIKAGALILAEIERLDRAALKGAQTLPAREVPTALREGRWINQNLPDYLDIGFRVDSDIPPGTIEFWDGGRLIDRITGIGEGAQP